MSVEVTDDDHVIVYGWDIDPWLDEIVSVPDVVAEYGGMAEAERWIEDNNFQLMGPWETIELLDGSWLTRATIEERDHDAS